MQIYDKLQNELNVGDFILIPDINGSSKVLRIGKITKTTKEGFNLEIYIPNFEDGTCFLYDKRVITKEIIKLDDSSVQKIMSLKQYRN